MADNYNPNDLGDTIRRSVEQAVNSINSMVGQIIGSTPNTNQQQNQQGRQQNTQVRRSSQGHGQPVMPNQQNSVAQAAQQVRTQFDAAPKYPEVYYQPGTAPMVQYQPQPGQPAQPIQPVQGQQPQGQIPGGQQPYIDQAYAAQQAQQGRRVPMQGQNVQQNFLPVQQPQQQMQQGGQAGAPGQRGRGFFGGQGGAGGNQTVNQYPMVETNTHINDSRYPDYMRTSRPAPIRTPNQTTQIRVTRKADAFPGEEENNARGITFLVFTIICAFFTFGMLGEIGDGEMSVAGSLIGMLFSAGLFGVFLYLFTRSKKKKKQYARFREYIKRYATQPQVSVLEMSAAMGIEPAVIRQDWKDMIELGVFPHGHFAPGDQVIFLSDEGYEKYMQAYGLMTPQLQTEAAAALPAPDGTPAKKQVSPEVAKALEQGRSYLLQLRNENDAIPGEVVTRKLDSLEDVCKRIFRVVEDHPEKLPEIRKFMEYYMPTTLKLVHTYREFEDQKLEGDNITRTKKDIEDTLDMINVAFENLLNDLFKDAAVEASADISVLNALFAQEGLKEKEFEVIPRK
ncbi:MAG: 5-bromo-4-chloroindolyl phosphate hydrolysis family protein [Lachnospiraceae bacterium]|nr:5-bromo-4-chloroindolyl phosphate hydrolysis family protein [Lachnospiraceae bacterium]